MNISLNTVRDRYQSAVKHLSEAEGLWRRLQSERGTKGIYLAYQAAARILMANYSWIPLTKLAYVKEAMRLFRQAVKDDPQNVEIRFLRFSIQHNLPAYLYESGNLGEDKAVIMAQFANYAHFQLQPQHLAPMLDFFQKSGRFSTDELKALKAVSQSAENE